MLSKSLIQFSVAGWNCVPSLLFAWGQTMVGPGVGRSPGEGNGNPLQYFCLENPMDRGAWWATVHGKVSDMTERLHFHFQTMVEVMKIMVTSFRRSHACTATLTASNPAAGHHQTTPPLDTPGHSHSSLGQSFVGSLLLFPGFWCTQDSVCALQESFSQSCSSLAAVWWS